VAFLLFRKYKEAIMFFMMILIIDMSNLEINISFYQVSTSKEQSNNPGAKPLSGLASLSTQK
jgi:hypothetical protein